MTGSFFDDDPFDDPLMYWRLCDELSVIDAAILIIGENPSEETDLRDSDGYFIKTVQRRDYPNLQPALKALRNSILNNRLRARLSFPARGVKNYSATLTVMGEPIYHTVTLELGEEEQKVVFDHLVSAQYGEGRLHLGGPIEIAQGSDELWIHKEPSWEQTTIAVSDLKPWLEERGIKPNFFFPKSPSTGFRDSNHARYAPKLACAVAAWEAVKRPQPNKSVKESLSLWIQANGVSFGLGDDSETVPRKTTEDIATVANWATKGGANPTSVVVTEALPAKIDNFDSWKQEKDDDGSEIPF